MIGNHLEPFKFWCQKVLPNVYDDSLSYYEYLCKLNEYLNEVIGQINTLTDNMEDYEEDLTATWLETKEYIDNYFNNLDVQQEINNKLDQMASSGALSTLLAPIVGTQIGGVVADQIGATVASQIGTTVASQIDDSVAGQIGEVTSPIVTSWLNENVDPVGSSVVVDKTLSINGASADAMVTGGILNCDGGVLYNRGDLLTQGKVISNGQISDNPFYAISDVISVKKNEAIYVKSYTDNTSVCLLAECQSDGTITKTLVTGTYRDIRTYNYVFTHDAYVKICLRTDESIDGIAIKHLDGYNIDKNIANIMAIEGISLYNYDTLETQGKVISYGEISDNPFYAISAPIYVRKGTSIIGRTWTDNTGVSVIVKCDSTGTIKEILDTGVSNNYKNINYTIQSNCYIRLCLRTYSRNDGYAFIANNNTSNVNENAENITKINQKLEKYIKTLNFIDNAKMYYNSAFVGQNGTNITGTIISGNSTIAIVEVEPSGVYYYSQLDDVYYNIVLYNADMEFISSMYAYHDNTGSWNHAWSVPDNCYYVGFVIGTSYTNTAYFGNEADYPKWNKNYIAELNNKVLTPVNSINHKLIATDNSMGNGETLSFDTSDIKQNYVFSFTGKLSGAFSSIYLAHGKTGQYSGMFVRVDNTNVYFYRYHSSDILVKTEAHGLTISNFITVSVELLEDESAKVIVTTTSGSFVSTNRWQGSKDTVSVGVENCTLTDCIFTFYCKDYDKPIWAFGDSYFYDYFLPRWPEIVIGYNYTNAMFDGFGGRTSVQAYSSLQKCLLFGTPSKILWCMGMNDRDNEAVNENWNTTYEALKDLCESNNIELILSTIPTTPTNDNNYKNAIIRNSGLRYVDVASAVGADGTGSWYNGLLADDNLHPSETGSKVIASRFMVDVPEMYNSL